MVLRHIVVVSGGVDGAAYVRQLLRAVAAGRLETARIHVVDRDPDCAAARLADPRVRIEVGGWGEWLDAHLDELGPGDHLVPYHWAPHVLLDWLERQARRRGARTARSGPVPPLGVPFERETRDGARALSYATWICPAFCIEPGLCPHTRGPRDWSLAADLAAPRPGQAFDARLVFRSLHLVWGVATIPMTQVLAARDRVVGGLARGPQRYLVATSSHCHALAATLEVTPPDALSVSA